MLRCPDLKSFSAYLLVFIKLTIMFIVLYGATNWIAEQRSFSCKLWMDWELGIPLVPLMILPYLSLNLLTVTPLFTLNEKQIRAMGNSMFVATLVASIVFLIFPAHIGFPRTTEHLGFWKPLFENLYSLDKSANTFPSLHIAYSSLVVRGIWTYARGMFSTLLMGWLLLIVAAVILTHQHHVIDVVGGLLLAEICFRKFSAPKTTS